MTGSNVHPCLTTCQGRAGLGWCGSVLQTEEKHLNVIAKSHRSYRFHLTHESSDLGFLDAHTNAMVIGLLAIAAIPTVTGVGQAISAQKKQNAASREQEKCYLAGMLPSSNGFEDAGFCVLIGGQVRGPFPSEPLGPLTYTNSSLSTCPSILFQDTNFAVTTSTIPAMKATKALLAQFQMTLLC